MFATESKADFDQVVRDLVPALATAPTIEDDRDLAEAGLDSIGVVELVLRLEKRFDIRFPDSALDAGITPTAGHFWNHITDQLRRQEQRERRAVSALRAPVSGGRP